MKSIISFKKIVVATALAVSCVSNAQNGGKFKVCLDAGHGNQDFGASYHGYVEKQINLAIILKLGTILEKDPSVDVIYTRKNDTFIELVERANIANRNKANIFVSVHCNANKNTEAYGSETYVMGLSKSASSLAVAKKENEVIKLEENYKTKYAGYNPNAPESLISATIAQEEYLDQSIELASRIQDNFDNKVNRKNRGVHQAPFMVLHKAFMPRVLVETGFISNPAEGAYLNSEEGQENMAKAIADAIFRMKAEYFGGNVPVLDIKKSEKPMPKDSTPKLKDVELPVKEAPKSVPVKPTVSSVDTTKVVFKIQLKASNVKIENKPENFNGLDEISSVFEAGYHKYLFGQTNSYEASKKLLAEAKSKGFESAFIVPFRNGVKISLNEAVKSSK
ncbi:N-acetylmuramoyl-L-alanine amidase family protein [Flavobacterium sp.]|uniref:N-acetylmuramoyl-L-alanine amidase family protein n=1 Tax=Flavobacterium sp. TaxID=239 RepID=UPI003D0FF43E